jgi:hypothetical protein
VRLETKGCKVCLVTDATPFIWDLSIDGDYKLFTRFIIGLDSMLHKNVACTVQLPFKYGKAHEIVLIKEKQGIYYRIFRMENSNFWLDSHGFIEDINGMIEMGKTCLNDALTQR